MSVSDPSNLYLVRPDHSKNKVVDKIDIYNADNEKARDSNSDIPLEGLIETKQNQMIIKEIEQKGEYFTIFIKEDPNIKNPTWTIDNAKITNSKPNNQWEWSADGLHGKDVF
ncbi:hypothetical protein [Natronoglomus mannanivorans]|uniref:Uncharacterized protein n=1 Tax=Natronoglomus mannanivorans TaxID=2979990 RepID=A0AAP2Z491_9EURY|nr:hypothetical protein [Halobacteria archaeon AArc-xg1-1]